MLAPIPHPLAQAGDARPAAPARRLNVWLAPPEAGDCFEVSQLSAADQQRWRGMNSRRRREDFAVSRALLNRVAPQVNDALSLSHSGGHAAICIGPTGCRVGIDVEWHRARDATAIARFAFHAAELAVLEAAASPRRERLFYAMWVFKEAAAKALRLDLLEALRHCTLLPQPDRWIGLVPTEEAWSAWIYEPRPGLSLAAVQVGGQPPHQPACLEWTGNAVRWPAALRADSPYEVSAGSAGDSGFFDNHRLAGNCCPHHDATITAAPQPPGRGPYRNAKPLSRLVKNPASKN